MRGRGRRGFWRQAGAFEVFARHLASSWGELVQHGGQRIAQRLGRSLLGLQHINAGSQCGRVTRGRLKLRGQALHLLQQVFLALSGRRDGAQRGQLSPPFLAVAALALLGLA